MEQLAKIFDAVPKVIAVASENNRAIGALALIVIFGIGAAYFYSNRPVPIITGSITTNNQNAGINNTGNLTINQEDHSAKGRMRHLLNSIDQRILYQVARGSPQPLKVRMQPFEFDRLQALIAEDKSLATVMNFGPVFTATIINGSLGTSQSGEQRDVILSVNPDISR